MGSEQREGERKSRRDRLGWEREGKKVDIQAARQSWRAHGKGYWGAFRWREERTSDEGRRVRFEPNEARGGKRAHVVHSEASSLHLPRVPPNRIPMGVDCDDGDRISS